MRCSNANAPVQFPLPRNFSLEEGKSAEKMEEANQPNDVRGTEDWCRSVDGLTTNLHAATIGRYQELLPC